MLKYMRKGKELNRYAWLVFTLINYGEEGDRLTLVITSLFRMYKEL